MTFRVEIAGSIAVGKSTLCEGLRAAGFEIIEERLEENHFLNRTYNDKAARGFDVMMSFVLSKAGAIASYQGKAKCVVADYAMISEYAYNDIHLLDLDKVSHKLCQQAIDLKRGQIGEPKILIVLTCPVAEQMRRIQERGRDFEKSLTPAKVRKLNDLVQHYVDTQTSPQTRIIRIDTVEKDLRNPQTIAGIASIIDEACRAAGQQRRRGPKPAP